MIVPLHAAAGAATGAATGSRLASVAVGPLLHVACDRVPHRHPARSLTEYASGALVLGILVRRRGLFAPVTIGALAAVLPDLDHVVPGLRIRGAKVFHRRAGGERRESPGLSVGAQTLLAVALLTGVLRRD